MSTHAPYSRPLSPWKAPASARRVPVPSDAAVAARPQRDALHAALDGTEPPCAADPEVWQPVTAAEAAPAIAACTRCPVLTQCAAYADALAPEFGVWAAADRTVRDGRRRQTDDEMERTA